MWLRQMAQLSTWMSARKHGEGDQNQAKSSEGGREWMRRRLPQAQSATAFHFLISRRLAFLQAAPAQEGEGTGAGTATATSPWSMASEP